MANRTVGGVINRPMLQPLTKGLQIFVNLRYWNNVGLVSAVMSSNGVVVGKMESTVGNGKSAAMALEPHTSVPGPPGGYAKNSSNTRPVPPTDGGTIAAAFIPAAAVGDTPTTFTGGAVDDHDILTGKAVNVSETPPPAQNFQFGDYTFTLKATDPETGAVQTGYQFQVPIILQISYDVAGLIAGTDTGTLSAFEPSLNIYDTTSHKWIPAKQTCPPPIQWDLIDHEHHMYEVAVCHLTQFAIFYQLRPVINLEEDFGFPILANASRALANILPHYHNWIIHRVNLARDAATGALVSQIVSLDARKSYDSDGYVAALNWFPTLVQTTNSLRRVATSVTWSSSLRLGLDRARSRASWHHLWLT